MIKYLKWGHLNKNAKIYILYGVQKLQKKKRNTADIKVNDLHCIVKVRFFQILPFV